MFIQRKRRRQTSRPTSSNELSRRRKGRPLKRAVELPTQLRSQDRHNQRFVPIMEQASSKSAFEKLPIEIIHEIFFESLEINLARTSSYLCTILSRESVYKALILFAFFPDDQKFPVEVKHFRPANYRFITPTEKIQLQEKIIQCRWFTAVRFRAVIPILRRLSMVQSWHAEKAQRCLRLQMRQRYLQRRHMDDHQLPPMLDIDNIADMNRYYEAIEDFAPETTPAPRIEPADPDKGYLQFYIQERSFVVNKSKGLEIVRGPFKAVTDVKMFPSSLISGNSWTDEKQNLLLLLLTTAGEHTDGGLVSANATSIYKGMKNAIQHQNIIVLTALLYLRCIAKRDQDVSHNHTTSSIPQKTRELVEVPLPLGLFHIATKQGPASSKILSLLIRGSINSIPSEDVVLTKWALHAQEAEDPLGTWLLEHMAGGRTYDLRYDHNCIFARDGKLQSYLSPDLFPVPHDSFFKELRY